LPEEIKDSMFSVETAETLRKIGETNLLNTKEITTLADETGLFMLGITNPNNFISNLASRLGIDKIKVKKVADEINNQVFSKIKESLKKIHKQNNKKAELNADIKPQKDIFEERNKKDIFQSKIETVERNYPKNEDPYREPTN